MRRPGPRAVGAHFQIIQRAGIAGSDLRLDRAQAGERPGNIRPERAGGLVEDHAGAGVADRLHDCNGNIRLPRR